MRNIMKASLLLTIPLIASAHVAHAQAPSLLRDINTVPIQTPSDPGTMPVHEWAQVSRFPMLGNLALLSATSLTHGTELWITSGSVAGTKMLRDIHSGTASSSPHSLCVTRDGKRAFFSANEGKLGHQLWTTDGTPAGTMLVKNIPSGNQGSNPTQIVPFGSRSVVFIATSLAAGRELFISDGTAKGTLLLKDLSPGASSSWLGSLRATRDRKKVFFTLWTKIHGSELWVTNGTAKGTKLVRDIRPGSMSSSPQYPTPLGASKIVFFCDDGRSGNELWVSDGTSNGTRLVSDLTPGANASRGTSTYQAISLADKVIFQGYSPGAGLEAHITDGTKKGTRLLIDAFRGPASGWMGTPHLDSTGKLVYWISYTGSGGYGIFVTDGTPKGSRRFTPKDIGGFSNFLVESSGRVYFQGRNLTPGTGDELCVSDGTLSGTKTLRDTLSGKHSGYARYLTRIGTRQVIYAADDAIAGNELWSMASGVTFQRIDINNPKAVPTQSSSPEAMFRFGNRMVFSATDGKAGHEAWLSDGTTTGTQAIPGFKPGIGGYLVGSQAALGDRIVFSAYRPGTGNELYITNGTSAGSKLLKDIRRGGSGSYPSSLTAIGGKVYFSANDGTQGPELWVTDGTLVGTQMLADIYPGYQGSKPSGFAGYGNRVVFRAYEPKGGVELYFTDGTSTGTRLLKDIQPGYINSYPAYLTFSAGKVYFSAYTKAGGNELWVTDFTSKGTVRATSYYRGSTGPGPTRISARNGRLYFRAYTSAGGYDLIASDGTAAGTKVLLRHQPGVMVGYDFHTAVGSRKIYAASGTPSAGNETVVTDGTKKGTKVLDINPGPGDGLGFFYYSRHYRHVLGSTVFLRGYHPSVGYEVFTVDNGATAEPIGSPYGSTWIHGSDPVLGKKVTIQGGSRLRQPSQLTFLGSLAPKPIPFGTAGFVYLDLSKFFMMTGITAGNRFGQSLLIPNQPSLLGVQVALQTFAFDARNLAGTLELSNGLHLTLGH